MIRANVFPLSIVLATAIGATQAFAGPATDKAEMHFKAIGAGDVGALQAEYDPTAVFQWVGGPLDGVYTGQTEISGLWSKFAKAQGQLKVDVMNIQESANPKGATISAAVKFSGKNTIPVRYVLVYRGDKLVNEIWQIDPQLKTAYAN